MCHLRNVWYQGCQQYDLHDDGKPKIYVFFCQIAVDKSKEQHLKLQDSICPGPLLFHFDDIRSGCPSLEHCERAKIDQETRMKNAVSRAAKDEIKKKYAPDHEECRRDRKANQKYLNTYAFCCRVWKGFPGDPNCPASEYSPEPWTETMPDVEPNPANPPGYPQGYRRPVRRDGKLHGIKTASFQRRAATFPLGKEVGTRSDPYVVSDQPTMTSEGLAIGLTGKAYMSASLLPGAAHQASRSGSSTPQPPPKKSRTFPGGLDFDPAAVDTFVHSFQSQGGEGVQKYHRQNTPGAQGYAGVQVPPGGQSYPGGQEYGGGQDFAENQGHATQDYGGSESYTSLGIADFQGYGGTQGQAYGSSIQEGFVPMSAPSRTGTPDTNRPPSRPPSRGLSQGGGGSHHESGKGKKRAYHHG